MRTLLYQVMCPRDYARWRSSWGYGRRRKRASLYFNQIQDAVPLVLAGHTQVRQRVYFVELYNL